MTISKAAVLSLLLIVFSATMPAEETKKRVLSLTRERRRVGRE